VRHTGLKLKILASLALTLGLASGAWAVGESFEGYANGYSIISKDAWSGSAEAGIVTNNAAAITALAAYTNAGGAFPLPNATHEKVLQIAGPLTNANTH
jgi:uncharacterized protein YdbL (DUF1318 family)